MPKATIPYPQGMDPSPNRLVEQYANQLHRIGVKIATTRFCWIEPGKPTQNRTGVFRALQCNDKLLSEQGA